MRSSLVPVSIQATALKALKCPRTQTLEFSIHQLSPNCSCSNVRLHRLPDCNSAVTMGFIKGASRTYIDTYENPKEAINEIAEDIAASDITVGDRIGRGEFGYVHRGKLQTTDGIIDVAIKIPRAGSSDDGRNDFLTEASIMRQFQNPNVVLLQGVVTDSNPVMIVTEYMENGSLDTFLRSNVGEFQTIQLVRMMRDIASGMQYLSEMNYVHRDLAARNVLVSSQLVCKIADFGLIRKMASDANGEYSYMARNGGKVPVKWTAPEALFCNGKSSSASDVWSMGIVCWEIMSYGKMPYKSLPNFGVIMKLKRGYRLRAPKNCPEAIHQLMLNCWEEDPTERPTFQSIVATVEELIRVPDTLQEITQNRARSRMQHLCLCCLAK